MHIIFYHVLSKFGQFFRISDQTLPELDAYLLYLSEFLLKNHMAISHVEIQRIPFQSFVEIPVSRGKDLYFYTDLGSYQSTEHDALEQNPASSTSFGCTHHSMMIMLQIVGNKQD